MRNLVFVSAVLVAYVVALSLVFDVQPVNLVFAAVPPAIGYYMIRRRNRARIPKG